jgi:tetratricopeptide (TPR) repeat protein
MAIRQFNNSMLFCGCVALVAVFALITQAQASPYTPTDDAAVIERLPFRVGDSTGRELSALRAAAASAPSDQALAVDLAQKYIDLAMARGDPRYVGYADAVIGRFSAQLSAPLLLVRGTLRQFRHDFAAALDDYAAALKLDADLAGAHAWRGAIYLVQANYVAAGKECAALQGLQRSVLFGGCAGLTLAYTGHLDDAYRTLQQALAVASDDGQRLWLHTRLAEISAWRGQPTTAEQHYRQALAMGKDDGYLLAAWSDFLLDRDRPSEVVKQLATWESSDGLLLRLSEAETRLNLPGAQAHRQMLDDRFSAARLRGDTTHRAEEARFHLRLKGDARLAVALAAENYLVQREPRDARILMEAALAAKDAVSARAALEWLQSSGFEDTRLRQFGRQLLLHPPAAPGQGVAQ